MAISQISPRLLSALTAVDSACGQDSTPDATRLRATARGLLRGYDKRWVDQPWRTESVEQEFCQPIYNLHAQSQRITKSRTFEVAGKKDVLALCDRGDRWVVDHKTTSNEIDKPDATFWQQLAIEGQASLYLLSEHVSGKPVVGALWDVIRKPGIRPKELSKAEQKAVTSVGTYFGCKVSDETKQYVVDSGDENAELYEHRVAHECCKKPHRYFQRREVLRLEQEIVDYAQELWELATEIRQCRQTQRHLRNSGSCLMYGRPCMYLGICSGYDQPDSNKWQPRSQVHEELETLTSDGRNVLTNSRLRCFQTCRRKHYYRYELGIESTNAELPEVLFLGNIVHTGLATWWSHNQENKK